jgi:hypothetical protein
MTIQAQDRLSERLDAGSILAELDQIVVEIASEAPQFGDSHGRLRSMSGHMCG